jgi:hypothetical protein
MKSHPESGNFVGLQQEFKATKDKYAWCLHYVHKAWTDVKISATQNCFMKLGLNNSEMQLQEHETITMDTSGK